MEKYSKRAAFILAILTLIATGVFGLLLILTIYPLAAILSDTEGKVFFVGGLVFFWVTIKTVHCLRSDNLPTYNLISVTSGTLYDTGGPSSTYQDDERKLWLIQPNQL